MKRDEGDHNETTIPDRLREYDHWVCWRFENRDDNVTKVPLKPFDASNPYAKASSTDPDEDPSETWRSFEQARTYHDRTETDTDGLGFVFTAEDMFVGVDLDDVRDPETGDVEPTAEDLLDRFGSYGERSPSGTGYHIITMGVIPDEAGHKRSFQRENDTLADVFDSNPDIEMYDSGRFFTMTGDHVAATPTEVTEAPKVVRSVAREYLTDDDTDEQAESTETGEPSAVSPDVTLDLDAESIIEKATNAANGDKFTDLYNGRWERYSEYPSQSEADLGFCQQLAFWTQCDSGRMDDIFRSSGLMREKWDEDRGSQTYGERTLEQACKQTTEVYDPTSQSAATTTPRGVTVTEPDDDAGRQALADAVGYDGQGTLVIPLGLNADEHGYYRLESSGEGNTSRTEVTSFLLAVRHRLNTPEDGEVYGLTVLPRTGASYDVAVPLSVFNEPRTFKSNVCTRGAAYLEGTGSDLNTLREAIVETDAPTRCGVRKLGLFGMGDTDTADVPAVDGDIPEFVFPDGTLRTNGWADSPDHILLERHNQVERNAALSPDERQAADYDREVVARILDLLPQTRDPERFIPVLGWAYATPFRPVVKAATGEFNHLTVTGNTGAGKSATLEALLELFGMAGTPLEVSNETKFTMMVHVAASNAVPVFYDEYKPAEIQNFHLDNFHSFYRKANRGGTASRGRQDRSTDGYHLDAPLVVAGESAVSGPAEQRRSIMTTFRDATSDPGTTTAQAYKALREHDPLDHAYALYQWVLGQLEDGIDEVLTMWETADDRVAELVADVNLDPTAFDDMERQGLQTVMFGVQMYRAFARDMGLDADSEGFKSVDETHVAEAVTALADDLANGERRQSHMEEFLGLLSLAAADGFLKRDEHYTLIQEGSADEELRVNFKESYPKVRRYVVEHDLTDDSDLLGRDDYRDRFKEAESESGVDNYVTVFSQPTGKIGRAIGIRIATADEQITDFAPRAFGATATAADTADTAASAECGGENSDFDHEDDRRTLLNHLRLPGGERISEDSLVLTAFERHGLEPERTRHLIKKLIESGHIIREHKDGEARLSVND